MLTKHPQYLVVKYFGTGEREAVDPKVRPTSAAPHPPPRIRLRAGRPCPLRAQMLSEFEPNLERWGKSAHKSEGLPESISHAKRYFGLENLGTRSGRTVHISCCQ